MTPRLWISVVFAFVALMLTAQSDNFTRCASTLGSSWTGAEGAITDWTTSDNAGACAGSSTGARSAFAGADYALAYWNGFSFTADQYSEAVITKGPSGYEGVAVRLGGTTGSQSGYGVDLASSTCQIYEWLVGVRSAIGSCSVTWTNGHTLRISITGSAITVTDNGSSIGTATNSDVSSGAAGILGYSDSGGVITSWAGDNVGGGGGATLPPALLLNPLRGCCR